MAQQTIGTIWNRDTRNDMNANFTELYEVQDRAIAQATQAVIEDSKLIWQEPVNTSTELETTYPNAITGYTVMVRDTGKVYRFNEGVWNEIQDIDPTAINEVDNRLSAELATKAQQTDVTRLTNDIKNKLPKVLSKPTGFSFSKNLVVVRNGKGKYSTNIKAKNFKPSITGVTYYAGRGGLDTNDGLTYETRFAIPYKAQTMPDVGEIIVTEGVYDRNEKAHPNKPNMIIRAMEGHEVIFGAHEKLTWILDGTDTYRTTRSTVIDCWDSSKLDENGLFMKLEKLSTLLEVKNTPNSWYTDGTTVYVHTHDNRVPDDELFVSIGVNVLFLDSAITGDFHGYIEGIKCHFGTTSNYTAKGANSKLIGKDCEFNYAGVTNGLSVIGFNEIIMENCKANGNYLDGFNYHASADGLWNGEVIEINCEGNKNGRTEGSNNGSTSHESYKTVRIGGEYHSNEGANVADVNNAESWNVGVVAGNSTVYEQDFVGNKVWLDSCYSNSKESLNVSDVNNTAGLGYTRSCVLFGEIIGSVSEYQDDVAA